MLDHAAQPVEKALHGGLVRVVGIGPRQQLARVEEQVQRGQPGIDQQVMVPGVGLILAGPGDVHAFDPEFDPDRAGYRIAISGCFEKDARAGR